jgi:4-hydroxy-3-methylbut-2-en-1-yl diphosphate reductase
VTKGPKLKKIILANPRGFCAGVDRAIDIVERALTLLGAPIYVRHEVVHNRYVVDNLRARGAIFTDDLDEIPVGSTVIFSAHGVSQAVRDAAKQRQFRVFDATCPLVTKVHIEVARFSKRGQECILIGHAGHPEVEGTLGQYDNIEGGMYLIETEQDVEKLTVKDPANLAFVTQTTLSVDDTQKIIAALQRRFPQLQAPKREDICYATQNRQDAVKELAGKVDVLLVVGSASSSNSNRLQELAERLGTPAYLIDDAAALNEAWFVDKEIIGVTAGASAPEILVQTVVAQLQRWGAQAVTEWPGREETITFALPKALRSEDA